MLFEIVLYLPVLLLGNFCPVNIRYLLIGKYEKHPCTKIRTKSVHTLGKLSHDQKVYRKSTVV